MGSFFILTGVINASDAGKIKDVAIKSVCGLEARRVKIVEI